MSIFKKIPFLDEALWDIGKGFFTKATTEKVGEVVKMTGPGQEQIIEAAIFDVAAEFLFKDAIGRQSFLNEPASLDAYNRVADDFYYRNPKHQDQYEIWLGQKPWWAIGDEGLGTRRREASKPASPPQQQGQGKKGGGQQQNQQHQRTGVECIDPVQLMLAIKVCLGKKALEADKKTPTQGRRNPKLAGDKIILRTIERFRQASALEKGAKAAKEGLKIGRDFITDFLNEI